MSQTRIHNFSISLDGFGTGEPQSLEAPFGHAGERLHEWMFATRFWEKVAEHLDGGVDRASRAWGGIHTLLQSACNLPLLLPRVAASSCTSQSL